MALTPEEKVRRKEVQNARDRAHRARKKERDAVEKRLEAEHKASNATRRFDTACAARDQADEDLKAALDEIDEQIKALVLKKEEVRQQFAPRRQAALVEINEAWKAMDAERRSIELRLDEMFPDLAGDALWSAFCWGAKCKKLEGAK